MRLSFLLRLDPRQLAHGHLVGEIEEVMTGQVAGVRSPADVVSFCAGAAGATGAETGAVHGENSTGGQG